MSNQSANAGALLGGALSDLKVNVRGREFNLHRFILEQHAPAIYRAATDGESKLDCDPALFETLCRWMYRDEVPPATVEMMLLCRQYSLDGLFDRLNYTFGLRINGTNVDAYVDLPAQVLTDFVRRCISTAVAELYKKTGTARICTGRCCSHTIFGRSTDTCPGSSCCQHNAAGFEAERTAVFSRAEAVYSQLTVDLKQDVRRRLAGV